MAKNVLKLDAKEKKAFSIMSTSKSEKARAFNFFFFYHRKVLNSLLSCILSPKINAEQFDIYCYPPEADSHPIVRGMCP